MLSTILAGNQRPPECTFGQKYPGRGGQTTSIPLTIHHESDKGNCSIKSPGGSRLAPHRLAPRTERSRQADHGPADGGQRERGHAGNPVPCCQAGPRVPGPRLLVRLRRLVGTSKIPGDSPLSLLLDSHKLLDSNITRRQVDWSVSCEVNSSHVRLLAIRVASCRSRRVSSVSGLYSSRSARTR